MDDDIAALEVNMMTADCNFQKDEAARLQWNALVVDSCPVGKTQTDDPLGFERHGGEMGVGNLPTPMNEKKTMAQEEELSLAQQCLQHRLGSQQIAAVKNRLPQVILVDFVLAEAVVAVAEWREIFAVIDVDVATSSNGDHLDSSHYVG